MTAGDKEKGFVIKDKRILNEENGAQADSASAGEPKEQVDMPLPAINFSTFVASLNASALVNLGIIADPGTGATAKDLPIAKQTIDIMSMLQEKTKGNLTVDEEGMLKSILYDLKLMYVKESK